MFFKLTSRWLLGFFYHHQNLASALYLYLLLPTQSIRSIIPNRRN